MGSRNAQTLEQGTGWCIVARVKIERVRHTIRAGVIGLFAVSGAVHFAKPRVFYQLMPPSFPARDLAIYASGAAEIVCSVGLLTRQAWAPRASAALLVAVWPGNLEYAARVTRKRGLGSKAAIIGWARMPLQVPMVWAVLADQSQVGRATPAVGVRQRWSGDNVVTATP
jgi:uncharacterized membrane protein